MKEIKTFEELPEELTLVDFYATWCGPCRMLAPVLEKLSKTRNIIKVNTDEAEELSEKFEIQVIPTLILFKDKTPIARREGYATEEDLEKWIKSHE